MARSVLDFLYFLWKKQGFVFLKIILALIWPESYNNSLMSERMTVHKKVKGIKKHGFLVRLKTASGRALNKRRRNKGRKDI